MFSKQELSLLAESAVLASQYPPLHSDMVELCVFLKNFDQCLEVVHLCKGFFFINRFRFDKVDELLKKTENDPKFKDANTLIQQIISTATSIEHP